MPMCPILDTNQIYGGKNILEKIRALWSENDIITIRRTEKYFKYIRSINRANS